MIIRRATIDDADKIYSLECDTFSVPWSLESISHDLEDEARSLYYIIEEGDQVIGYAGAWMVLDEGQITNVAVRKEYRGDGNGTILVRKLLHELFQAGMNEVFLEVRISNVHAIALYRKLGFTVKGLRKSYYADPVEDAYIMSREKEINDD